MKPGLDAKNAKISEILKLFTETPIIFTLRAHRVLQEEERVASSSAGFLVVLLTLGVTGAEAGSAPSRYSQVVYNATEGRFEADGGWVASFYGSDVYEGSYRVARPAGDESLARFKAEIPTTADYVVYARWPGPMI
jgi:hypothetical protein